MATSTLVVREPGSDWPEFVCATASDVIAWTLQSGVDDALRLQRACERTDRSDAPVQIAVVACNKKVDEASVHWRAFTASRLLVAVSRIERGRLVLSGPKNASAALCLGLLGLATILCEALPECLASVSVRIGDRVVWLAAQRFVRRTQGETPFPKASLERTPRRGPQELSAVANLHRLLPRHQARRSHPKGLP